MLKHFLLMVIRNLFVEKKKLTLMVRLHSLNVIRILNVMLIFLSRTVYSTANTNILI